MYINTRSGMTLDFDQSCSWMVLAPGVPINISAENVSSGSNHPVKYETDQQAGEWVMFTFDSVHQIQQINLQQPYSDSKSRLLSIEIYIVSQRWHASM